MSALAQTLGFILCAIFAAIMWSPWALLIAGLLLLIVPEIGRLLRRKE